MGDTLNKPKQSFILALELKNHILMAFNAQGILL
jgi:hypothetical protein